MALTAHIIIVFDSLAKQYDKNNREAELMFRLIGFIKYYNENKLILLFH